MKQLKLSKVIEDISDNYDKEDFYREIFIDSAIVELSSDDTSCHMTGSTKLCYGSEGLNVYVGQPGSDPTELGKKGSHFISLLMTREGDYSVGRHMGEAQGLVITRSVRINGSGKYLTTLEVSPQDDKTFYEV